MNYSTCIFWNPKISRNFVIVMPLPSPKAPDYALCFASSFLLRQGFGGQVAGHGKATAGKPAGRAKGTAAVAVLLHGSSFAVATADMAIERHKNKNPKAGTVQVYLLRHSLVLICKLYKAYSLIRYKSPTLTN
jgi:hypothetical protein